MDTLNVVSAVLASITVVVAIFVTRNHRHDLISLGVPLLGIVFSVIPLARVLLHANKVPEQVARLSVVQDAESSDIAPCADDLSERQLRATVAVLKKELNATQPFQFVFTHLMSLILGVCSSLVAHVLTQVQSPA